jgi:hypothetical protein
MPGYEPSPAGCRVSQLSWLGCLLVSVFHYPQ